MRTLVPHRDPAARAASSTVSITSSTPSSPSSRRPRAPAVDILEEDKAYVLHAELPGVAEKEGRASAPLQVPKNKASKAREIPIKAG